MALATRKVCTYRPTSRCYGDHKTTKCPGCKGALATWFGSWGVFVWDASGVYPRDAAIVDYASEKRAETFAAKDERYVVRWIAS